MPIKHEGADYFSKDEVENIVKDRVKREEALVAKAEARVKELEPLAAKVPDLESQLAGAQGNLGRYQAATSHGITDPDTIEALQAAHEKAAKFHKEQAAGLKKLGADHAIVKAHQDAANFHNSRANYHMGKMTTTGKAGI